MPYPSRACQTCKSRRIKCDEARPACQRCVRSRRVCVEKRAVQAAFAIHNENAYASGKTRRPRGPRPGGLSLMRPRTDLASQATAYCLGYHLCSVQDLPTISACMSECLVSWKRSGRECNMVDLAVSSLALAIFSQTQHHERAAGEACLAYGRLLRAARERITELAFATCDADGADEFLLTIGLMAWYETVMYRPAAADATCASDSISSSRGFSHHDGGMAVLKIWNDRLSRHNAPSGVVKQFRRTLVRWAPQRNVPLPGWILDGSRFGEQGLDLGFDVILVRIAGLRCAFESLRPRKPLRASDARRLADEALALDEKCHEWAMQVPAAWSYRIHSFDEPARDLYSSAVYVYQSPGCASVWIQYFAARMLIESTHLGLLLHLGPPPSEDDRPAYVAECVDRRARLTLMADSFASSVPFSLGRINVAGPSGQPTLLLQSDDEILPSLVLPIIWPLSMVLGLDGIEAEQARWFQSQLARLSRILGNGALKSAGAADWTQHDDNGPPL